MAVNKAKFDFLYIDRVIERPALKTLICSALKGSVVGCADIMDEAFAGLTKRQRKHFAKLLTKIFREHVKRHDRAVRAEKRAQERNARLAAVAERELAEEREVRKFTPTWTIVGA